MPTMKSPIGRHGGVYALVLSLLADERISLGRTGAFGTHTFAAGWYVYLGSAHGGGGLQARTDRHRRRFREGKKGHWHIDWFREHATIHEIWFSHASSFREHDWATVMHQDMPGCSIPVAGFGSRDCHAACPAHLVYVGDRPVTAAFRAAIQTRWPEHEPIYTEHVEPWQVDRFTVFGEPSPDLATYHRGRRYLERRRRAHYDGLETSPCSGSLTTFSCDPVGTRILNLTAEDVRCSATELKRDAKFAEAVDVIVGTCGPTAVSVLFAEPRPQSRKAIEKLSRTADSRQRYRIEGVDAGRFRSVAPQNADSVFDTLGFHEVVSRLARASGCLREVGVAVRKGVALGIADECCRLGELCRQSALQLRMFLRGSAVRHISVPASLSRDTISEALAARSGHVVGRARCALRLAVKSIWDFPEMHRRRMRPTPDQAVRVEQELEKLIVAANDLMPQSSQQGQGTKAASSRK